MNLNDVLNNSTVLIDANILIYATERKSVQCRELLQRVDAGAIRGVCTTIIVAELSHRCMINEAQSKGMITSSSPARALSRQRNTVTRLSDYAEIVRDILSSALVLEAVREEDFHVALELQKQHGLLTNDSLNLAVAKRLGIKEIATADSHFDAVQGLIVYKPDDLNFA